MQGKSLPCYNTWQEKILSSKIVFKESQKTSHRPSVRNKCEKFTHIHVHFQSMLSYFDLEGMKMSNPCVHFENKQSYNMYTVPRS